MKEIFTLMKFPNGSYTIILQTDKHLTREEAQAKADQYNGQGR